MKIKLIATLTFLLISSAIFGRSMMPAHYKCTSVESSNDPHLVILWTGGTYSVNSAWVYRKQGERFNIKSKMKCYYKQFGYKRPTPRVLATCSNRKNRTFRIGIASRKSNKAPLIIDFSVRRGKTRKFKCVWKLM